MEILGTHFILSMGAWRLRFVLAVEDAEPPAPAARPSPPHHLTVGSTGRSRSETPDGRR